MSEEFKPLPLDFDRCKPLSESETCNTCQRWADHPNQTWGPRTSVSVRHPFGKTCDKRGPDE